jgi:POT family proton-dependent oligopeptide transporter
MIGEIFNTHDSTNRDAAFNIYYMSIYIGAFIAPMLSGFLQQKYGFMLAFIVSASFLLIALIFLLKVWNKSLNNIGLLKYKPTNKIQNARHKTITYLILCISNILSNTFYVLPYGIFTLYTYRNINRNIYGFEVPVTWYLGFHTLCVILFSFLLARLYNGMGSRYSPRITLSIKLAMGYIILAVALFIIIPFVTNAQSNSAYIGSQISLIIFYILFALNKTLNTPTLLSASSAFATPGSASQLAAYNMAISWGVGYWVGSEIIIYFNKHANIGTLLYWSAILCIIFALAHLISNKKIERILRADL